MNISDTNMQKELSNREVATVESICGTNITEAPQAGLAKYGVALCYVLLCREDPDTKLDDVWDADTAETWELVTQFLALHDDTNPKD